jgi:hypothetical protein
MDNMPISDEYFTIKKMKIEIKRIGTILSRFCTMEGGQGRTL